MKSRKKKLRVDAATQEILDSPELIALIKQGEADLAASRVVKDLKPAVPRSTEKKAAAHKRKRSPGGRTGK